MRLSIRRGRNKQTRVHEGRPFARVRARQRPLSVVFVVRCSSVAILDGHPITFLPFDSLQPWPSGWKYWSSRSSSLCRTCTTPNGRSATISVWPYSPCWPPLRPCWPSSISNSRPGNYVIVPPPVRLCRSYRLAPFLIQTL